MLLKFICVNWPLTIALYFGLSQYFFPPFLLILIKLFRVLKGLVWQSGIWVCIRCILADTIGYDDLCSLPVLEKMLREERFNVLCNFDLLGSIRGRFRGGHPWHRPLLFLQRQCTWMCVDASGAAVFLLNPNSIRSYKIVQKLSPKHAARGIAQSPYPTYRHGKACLSKQPPWRAAGDPRLARGRSRVRARAQRARCARFFSPPSLPSSFGR